MIDKFWLVWNENKERCDFPTFKHLTMESANQEAERLARLQPGQKFSVLELIGTVTINDTKWEHPIPF